MRITEPGLTAWSGRESTSSWYARLSWGMLTDARRTYLDLYELQGKPFLYSSPWWLDAVCPGSNWDAFISNDQAEAGRCAIPYFTSRIRGLSAITTPPATQWISAIAEHSHAAGIKQSWFDKFPASAIMDLSVNAISEWSPKSHPVAATTRYSYVLPYATSPDKMRSGYNEGLRRNLKQAEINFDLRSGDQIDVFTSLCIASFRQNKAPWWMNEILPILTRVLLTNGKGNLHFVYEGEKPVATMLTGWDEHMLYYVAGGRLETDTGSAAHALLLDHAVWDAQHRGVGMDFEGSMIPGIANFFQSFGARPVPYYQLRRYQGAGKLWRFFH